MYIYINIYGFVYINCLGLSHRGINVDHGINLDQHIKPQKPANTVYTQNHKTSANLVYCICTCFVVLSVDLHEFHGLH
jgi:hypothetical protein